MLPVALTITGGFCLRAGPLNASASGLSLAEFVVQDPATLLIHIYIPASLDEDTILQRHALLEILRPAAATVRV